MAWHSPRSGSGLPRGSCSGRAGCATSSSAGAPGSRRPARPGSSAGARSSARTGSRTSLVPLCLLPCCARQSSFLTFRQSPPCKSVKVWQPKTCDHSRSPPGLCMGVTHLCVVTKCMQSALLLPRQSGPPCLIQDSGFAPVVGRLRKPRRRVGFPLSGGRGSSFPG